MQVILLESIARLGNMGETVSVKPGYARNFLLPQGKALSATNANVARFEEQKKELEAQNAERKSAAETVAAKLDGQTVTIQRAASETGMLYGSVKTRDISDALNEKNIEVARAAIQIGEPMKMVGEYTVNIALHPEVQVKLPVNVERQSS